MKILLVNDYAVPTAGAEIMLLSLRNGLRGRDHDVRVFSSDAQLIPGPSFADWTCRGTTSRLQALSSTFNPSALAELKKVLNEFKADIVHVKMFLWQLSPAILSVVRNVPAVYHIVTFKPICPNGRKLLPDGSICRNKLGRVCLSGGCLTLQSWLAMMLQHKLWKRNQDVFDAFITPSRMMKDWLEAEGVGPVEVFPNGCNSRPARPPLSGEPIFAYAGRLSYEKGVGTLIRAFAMTRQAAPAARLWIVGDGPEADSLKSLAGELGVASCIEFMGALPFEEMDRRFERAWAQVVPSIWNEPFGMVAIEGIMRGNAVVASRSGGLAEIVDDGESGILFTPGNETELAGALTRLAGDRDLCESLGTRGHEIALERYSLEGYIDRIEGLYKRLINGAPLS
jgi:glycosyltransferase involved in cell wall biosynthesis